jgi:hypothetical protein
MIKYILNFEWLLGVSTAHAKLVFLGLFILIGLVVSLLPAKYVLEGVKNPQWYHNLKLWAYLDLAFIFTVYCIF